MPNNTTVIGVQEIDAFIRALQSYGITTPEWLVIIILVVILLAKISGYIDNISSGLNKIKTLMARRSDYDQKQFIALRNNFIKHLTYEVERLNREADWADFNYSL